VDSTNAATTVILGLYSDSAGKPGTLMTQGTITNPTKAAWNKVTVTNANVTSGTKYWIAAVSPAGSGTLRFRDVATGGPASASTQTNLTALPATWSAGGNYANSPMSAYAAQNPGASMLPSGGSSSGSPAAGDGLTDSSATALFTVAWNVDNSGPVTAKVGYFCQRLSGDPLGDRVTALNSRIATAFIMRTRPQDEVPSVIDAGSPTPPARSHPATPPLGAVVTALGGFLGTIVQSHGYTIGTGLGSQDSPLLPPALWWSRDAATTRVPTASTYGRRRRNA
jgi:hypothetical protein